MRKLVIAVDFDGTCVEHRFPHVGEPMPHAVEVLRALAARGHKLVLWTCRENDEHRIDRQHLTNARRWFEQHGIPLRSVNETHPEDEFRDLDGKALSRGRKVYADLYVDDRNVGGFAGWLHVLEVVSELEAGRWRCCQDETCPPRPVRACQKGHGYACHEHHEPHE